MKSIVIDGATRVLGAPRGWNPQLHGPCDGLAIRDSTLEGGQACMVSAWRPTREQLDRLNKGAAIELCVVGIVHPPVAMSVGPVPATSADFPAEAIGAAIAKAIELEEPPAIEGGPEGSRI